MAVGIPDSDWTHIWAYVKMGRIKVSILSIDIDITVEGVLIGAQHSFTSS